MKQHNPHIIPKILLQILQKIQQNPEPFVMKPRKDFTRRRSFSLMDVLLSILTMGPHKTKKELYHYFSPLNRHVPYNSAFSQQRAKLNNTVFPFILASFNNALPFRKKLKGFHAIGIDGSDVNIPADIRDCATFIPYNSRDGGYHQLHINAAFDLCEERFVDIAIQPRREFNETDAACDLVDRNPLDGKCLYFCDRGYESFNLMAHIIEKEQFFLIRAKDISSTVSPYHHLSLPDDDMFDIDIKFSITRSYKKVFKDNPQTYKIFPSNVRFDYIAPEDKESTYSLSFRLIKIHLDNGVFEYLITNLPRKTFRITDMKDLYHLRWGIETSFLFLKYGVCLNYFHSIKTERLYQEIYARIILFNYISLIIQCVELPHKSTKYRYKIAFTDAVYLCRDLLLGIHPWEYVCLELLKHTTPIRPGRQYPRKVVSQRLRTLQHRS